MQILIIDDHPLTCAGLHSLLSANFPDARLHACYTADSAKRHLEAHTPDWIFLDIHLPDDPSYSLFQWLQTTPALLRTILISAEVETRFLRQALAAGVRGFIPKSADPKLLLDGFAEIRSGKVFVPAQHVNHLDTPKGPALTQRQQAVYALLLKGHANKVIARELNLSEHTVKEYVSAILSVYGVSSRLELVLQRPNEPTLS